MLIRPNTSSTIQITSILPESALPHTGGVQNPGQLPNEAYHPHQALRLIRKITSLTRLSPSNPLPAAHPRAHPRPRPLITDGRRPISSCHHRFRFRNNSTAKLLRHPSSQILGQMDLLFHKTTPIREDWIPSIGAGEARTISGFNMASKGDTLKMPTTPFLRSHAESAETTLTSIIIRMNRPPSTTNPLCPHCPRHRSRISGRSMSRRMHAGTGRGRWMIWICISWVHSLK